MSTSIPPVNQTRGPFGHFVDHLRSVNLCGRTVRTLQGFVSGRTNFILAILREIEREKKEVTHLPPEVSPDEMIQPFQFPPEPILEWKRKHFCQRSTYNYLTRDYAAESLIRFTDPIDQAYYVFKKENPDMMTILKKQGIPKEMILQARLKSKLGLLLKVCSVPLQELKKDGLFSQSSHSEIFTEINGNSDALKSFEEIFAARVVVLKKKYENDMRYFNRECYTNDTTIEERIDKNIAKQAIERGIYTIWANSRFLFSQSNLRIIEKGKFVTLCNLPSFCNVPPVKQELFIYFTNSKFPEQFKGTDPRDWTESDIKILQDEMEQRRTNQLNQYKDFLIESQSESDERITIAIQTGKYDPREGFRKKKPHVKKAVVWDEKSRALLGVAESPRVQ